MSMTLDRLFGVAGSVAVVTGGASGIGQAIAAALSQNGCDVTLFDIAPGTPEVAKQMSAGGAKVSWAHVDATDDQSLKDAFDAVAARAGRLDLVYANAGISGGPGFLTLDGERNAPAALEQIAPAFFDRIVSVNLGSVFRTVQAAVPHLKRNGGGRVVVTSSISASRVETFVGTAYVASKAGVAQLVRQLALELARYGITVNALAPGPVATNIAGGRLRDEVNQARFGAHCPMHRIGTPEDIVGAALFFASPAARFVTGAEIVIDGGLVLGRAD